MDEQAKLLLREWLRQYGTRAVVHALASQCDVLTLQTVEQAATSERWFHDAQVLAATLEGSDVEHRLAVTPDDEETENALAHRHNPHWCGKCGGPCAYSHQGVRVR